MATTVVRLNITQRSLREYKYVTNVQGGRKIISLDFWLFLCEKSAWIWTKFLLTVILLHFIFDKNVETSHAPFRKQFCSYVAIKYRKSSNRSRGLGLHTRRPPTGTGNWIICPRLCRYLDMASSSDETGKKCSNVVLLIEAGPRKSRRSNLLVLIDDGGFYSRINGIYFQISGISTTCDIFTKSTVWGNDRAIMTICKTICKFACMSHPLQNMWPKWETVNDDQFSYQLVLATC